MRRSLVAIAGLAVLVFAVGGASAQRPSSSSARELAPIDLTGYWVSYVTENWRYRMVTPAKGEYRRIPASPAALPIINAWDPVADQKAGNQCKSYGAAAIMTGAANFPISAPPALTHGRDNWDPAADERAGNQCKSYGAGAIMKWRLRVSPCFGSNRSP